jgi:tetratricopeptide (TPR) repeat protein
MKMPRFVKRWRRKRDGLRKSPLAVFWQSVKAPFQRGWSSLNQARKKRSYQNLWWGLPALALAICAISLGVAANLRASRYAGIYRRLAIKHYTEGDFESARVFLERVYRDGDTGDDVTFFLASTLDGQGETQRANAMVDSLSPDDSVGYPEAHLMKARVLLAARTFSGKSAAQRAFHHLDAAASKFKDDPEWLSLKADFYLMVGQPEEALSYLDRAARLDPNRLFKFGMVYQELGRTQEAQEQLKLAEKHLAKLLGADSRDHGARLNLAAVLTEKGEFARATEILTEGLSLDKTVGFDTALAKVCLAQYKQLLSSPNTRPELRLSLLRNALKYDRNSNEAVRLLAFFGEEGGSTPETLKNATDFLEAMVAQGQESAIAHLALGSKAWQSGDQSKSAFHLKRAYKIDSGMAVLANNLAWVLAHQKQPDLQQALAVIDTVLIDYPNVPHFRDTRGQILTKMGRWSEALDDLEYALRTLPKEPTIHASLASVYMNISPPQPEMARKHQRLEKAILAASAR